MQSKDFAEPQLRNSRPRELKEVVLPVLRPARRSFAAKLPGSRQSPRLRSGTSRRVGRDNLTAIWINLKALVDIITINMEYHGGKTETWQMDWVLDTYRRAIDKNLPVGIRPLVDAQLIEIEKAHDYLKGRRDATAPKH